MNALETMTATMAATTKTSMSVLYMALYARFKFIQCVSQTSVCIFTCASSPKQKKSKRHVLHPNAEYNCVSPFIELLFMPKLTFLVVGLALWTTTIDDLVNSNQITRCYCHCHCYYTQTPNTKQISAAGRVKAAVAQQKWTYSFCLSLLYHECLLLRWP